MRRAQEQDRITFKQSRRENRDWGSMTREGIISYAMDYIREQGISARIGLIRSDQGLYRALRSRDLLDAVFSDTKRSKDSEALREVVEALGEFE